MSTPPIPDSFSASPSISPKPLCIIDKITKIVQTITSNPYISKSIAQASTWTISPLLVFTNPQYFLTERIIIYANLFSEEEQHSLMQQAGIQLIQSNLITSFCQCNTLPSQQKQKELISGIIMLKIAQNLCLKSHKFENEKIEDLYAQELEKVNRGMTHLLALDDITLPPKNKKCIEEINDTVETLKNKVTSQDVVWIDSNHPNIHILSRSIPFLPPSCQLSMNNMLKIPPANQNENNDLHKALNDLKQDIHRANITINECNISSIGKHSSLSSSEQQEIIKKMLENIDKHTIATQLHQNVQNSPENTKVDVKNIIDWLNNNPEPSLENLDDESQTNFVIAWILAWLHTERVKQENIPTAILCMTQAVWCASTDMERDHLEPSEDYNYKSEDIRITIFDDINEQITVNGIRKISLYCINDDPLSPPIGVGEEKIHLKIPKFKEITSDLDVSASWNLNIHRQHIVV